MYTLNLIKWHVENEAQYLHDSDRLLFIRELTDMRNDKNKAEVDYLINMLKNDI